MTKYFKTQAKHACKEHNNLYFFRIDASFSKGLRFYSLLWSYYLNYAKRNTNLASLKSYKNEFGKRSKIKGLKANPR